MIDFGRTASTDPELPARYERNEDYGLQTTGRFRLQSTSS